MVTLLKPVALAERCLLSELLYWVALRRFPLAISDLDDGEFRFSSECEIFARSVLGSPVSFAECEFASLSPNPRYTAFVEGIAESDFAFLERMSESIKELAGADREYQIAERDEIIAKAKQVEEWDREFKHFMDLYKAKIFIDLREGKLVAESVTIIGSTEQELRKSINGNAFRAENLEFKQVNKSLWYQDAIDWENSILFGHGISFCWIRFDVESMLSIYKMPELEIAGTVSKLCDSYIFENQNHEALSDGKPRGRPSLPWELFHVEVAARVKTESLPAKKDAAIAELTEWFREKHRLVVSRSSISQKLAPYYQHFFPSNSKNR